MMKWGRRKPVSSSSSWFSKLSGSSDLKPAKEKKQDDEANQKMSAKSSLSSTKHGNDIHERSKRFQRVSIQKKNATTSSQDMESNDKFKEVMRDSVEARDRDKETMIMTPRIQVKRDKQRCERRDQKLLEQKPKRLEQDTEVKAKEPMRRTCTRSYSIEDSVVLDHTETKPVHQWQKLKETKLREVKLKVEQQRNSMYIRRDLNGLRTKENIKVRVFSPRTSEKCKVKAIEDLKKAKLRTQEHKLMVTTKDGGTESESFAVVKCSNDPQKDFRDSMIEMIMENGINHPEELKELLICYLKLNTDEYHDMIIKVFHQVYNDLNFHYFVAE